MDDTLESLHDVLTAAGVPEMEDGYSLSVVQRVRRMARFKSIAQEAAGEAQRERDQLREELMNALVHLEHNKWVGDANSDRRFLAVQQVRAALGILERNADSTTEDGHA